MSVRALLMPLSMAALLIAAAEPAPVRLVEQPALGALLAAFPRLAAPEGPPARRINQALTNADDRLRSAVAQCHALAAEPPGRPRHDFWERGISVPMRGPDYLALVASDTWYCGGAHPSAARVALAYDLHTGAPLNWQRLLPAALVATVAVETAGDGTSIGVVASPALTAFYLNSMTAPDCAQVLKDTELQFILWPDAKREGIALEPFGLPHAVAACGADTVIPLATLRQAGMAPAMLDAIATAHKSGSYGPTP